MIQLRPDQFQLKASVYQSWQSGNRNVLSVLPTGGGKSVVMSDIAFDYRHVEQAIIAHRQELVGQMSLHVARRGIKHKIIAPDNVIKIIREQHREEFNGRHFINPSATTAVAGIGTINSPSRSGVIREWAKKVAIWQMDEAHHVLVENQWGKGVALFENALGIGWTASPKRADGKGLGAHADGVFNTMVQGLTMRELINIGALCDYEVVCPASDFNRETLTLGTEDFTRPSMRKAVEASHLVGDIVTAYIQYAYGKRCISFVPDVKTAQEVAAKFNAWGIPAAAVSAESDDTYRDEMIRRFKRGSIWVLVNVDLFGEGFDVPGVEVVSMGRPTQSLAVYLQQFGRAMRTAPGKLIGLVIDHVSNFKVHKHPDRAHFWTLDRRDKRASSESDPDDVPIWICKGCSKPYEQIHPACPYCGTVREVVSRGGRGAIELVEGDLTRLDLATLEAMRKATMLQSPGAAASAAYFAGGVGAAHRQLHNAQDRLAAQSALNEAIALWAALERLKGRPDDQTYRRFYHATGGVDVITALTLKRDEMEALERDVRRWMSA